MAGGKAQAGPKAPGALSAPIKQLAATAAGALGAPIKQLAATAAGALGAPIKQLAATAAGELCRRTRPPFRGQPMGAAGAYAHWRRRPTLPGDLAPPAAALLASGHKRQRRDLISILKRSLSLAALGRR